MVESNLPQDGHYVRANGLNMYYEEFGSGEPLVLLHGGMAIGRIFEPQIPAFSQQFHIFAPDLRGHGRTDSPSSELSYRLMADDLASFITTLKLDRPLVCGWSDGGQIALELGMHYPELMSGMVVGAAWYRFSEQYQGMLKAIGIESPGVVNFEKVKQTLPPLVEMWRSWHSPIHGPAHWETLATHISSLWWTPLGYTADDFRKIKTPTLILVGDRDQVVPLEEAVEMHRFIQGSELAIVPNADHSLPRSRPELFTATVLDFLLRHH